MDKVLHRNFWMLGLLLTLSPINTQAIPNQFGGGGFINVAGMRLEDFAAQKGIWQANADLKGDWEMWKDEAVTDPTIELLHLKMNATVFGVKASEITVQRRDDKILQFQVVFDTETTKAESIEKLGRMIKRNASVWSGNSDTTANKMKQGVSEFSFKTRSQDEQVVVTITKLAK